MVGFILSMYGVVAAGALVVGGYLGFMYGKHVQSKAQAVLQAAKAVTLEIKK